MGYRLIDKPIIQGGDLGLGLNIRILASGSDDDIVAALLEAVSDHRSEQYNTLRVRAYATEQAVTWNGWQAEAIATPFEPDVFINFDNDPELRKFLYEQGQN